ncbi:MAG: DUF5063 domain-containing protein [Muribaculaceae bacterium]|nr:DUF5063 domain-containing protein [Muribaculaceae bacterium]MDE7142802.1 DUF5063 domain-containing protein [Muribaculaceae bacterium]
MELSTNSIAFIGLCNEYCVAVEGARDDERSSFVESMLRLLPRIYIAATDLRPGLLDDEEAYIDQALDEDYYDAVRRNIERLLGPDDVYLEVFEEDMKYSDTPVAASVSEGLADIFQVLFNFISTIRDATDETVALALQAVSEDFRSYWSGALCNVLRALNHIRYQASSDAD